jgi:methyltransferase (TIGR00027 family)
MKSGQASRTAEHNALFRALETSRPEHRQLVADPLARAFLTWPLSLVGRAAALPGVRRFLFWYIDRSWPGVRTSVVARTRLIDDAITAAAAGPLRQLVILGAGYDTRPYRLPALEGMSIFEVDHPDTQASKRRALQRVSAVVPGNVRYVASDFNLRRLESAMAAAGYRDDLPTIFLWEGVTNYLTEAAVDATLRWCAGAAAGSLLIFTYIHLDVLTDPQKFVGTERLFATLDKVGEKLTFGIDPAHLEDFLGGRGLSVQRDLGASEYRELVFGPAARAMRGHEFYRLAFASVGVPTTQNRAAAPAAPVVPVAPSA